MFFLPGVVHALQLLHWLYPTLEFSVFSVFAEEAVHHSLDLVRQLVKFMRQIDSSDALRDTKAYLCQLSHLQHLESELSHVDANITVVERHLSFAGLRESRLELEQSSRESKKEVQVDLLKCSEQLTTAMLGYVTQPLSGAAKKGETERRKLVAEMKGRAAGVERMIAFYIEHHETLIDLVSIIRERTAELAAEVDVPLESVAATTVPVRAIALPQLPAPQAESKGSSATPSNVSSPDGPAPEAVAAPAEGNATATPNEAPASSPLPPPPAYSETAPSVQTLPPPPLSAPKTGETERAYSHPRPVKHSDDTDLI